MLHVDQIGWLRFAEESDLKASISQLIGSVMIYDEVCVYLRLLS